jgi:RHS repeat-associated protein
MSSSANVGATGTVTFSIGSCCTLVGTLTATLTNPVSVAPVNGGTQNVAADKTDTTQFIVKSFVAGTYNLTKSCTWGGSGLSCSLSQSQVTLTAGGSATISVIYQAGTPGGTGVISLTATDGANSTYTASATANVTSAWLTYMSANTGYTNQEDQDMSRCAAACFAATASLSTAPYITRDTPRSVTLAYNGDALAIRPIIYADVSLAAGAYTVQKFQLQAYVNGVWATFTNNETVLNFNGAPVNGSAKSFRLAGAINATSLHTGAFGLKIVVTAVYSDHQEQITDSSHVLAIYDARSSGVARGWAVMGLTYLYSYYYPDGHFDQSRILVPSGDGSSILYTLAGCNSVCTWTPPTGVFSTIKTLSGGGFERDFPDSSKELYNATGQLSASISRTQADTVAYTYDGTSTTGRLIHVTDPHRMYNGAHTYIQLNYGTYGLQSIVEPASNGAPNSGGRTTSVSVNASDSLLHSWTDPDQVSTRFGYDSNKRLDSLADRNGNPTMLVYEPTAWKLAQKTSPSVPIDAQATGSPVPQQLVKQYAPWQLVSIPTGPTNPTPATPVETDTIQGRITNAVGRTSRFTTDPWGQPQVSIDVLGDTTRYSRDANGFARTVTYPTGGQDTYTHSGAFLTQSQHAGGIAINYHYAPFAQVDSTWGIGLPTVRYYPNAGARGRLDSSIVAFNGAKTTYTYDALTRVTQVVDPLGHTTQFSYDTATGNQYYSVATPSNRYTKKIFDHHGRDSRARAAGQPSTAAVYDSLNRVVKAYDGVHATPITYKYDGLNQDTVIDATGLHKYATTYNALGWPMSTTDPAGDTSSMTYYATGLVATSTNRRHQRTTFLYDSAGRDTSVVWRSVFPGEADTASTFRYVNKGTIVVAQNGYVLDTTYVSGTAGWTDSVVTWFKAPNKRFKRFYHHNNLGQVDSIKITTNATGIDFYTRHYLYDPSTTLLKAIKLDTVTTTQFGYTSELLRDSVTFPSSGVVRTDSISDVHTVLSTGYGAAALLNQAFSGTFAYDSASRLTEYDYGNAQVSELLSYDGLSQLTGRKLGSWNQQYNCRPGGGYDGYPCSDTTQFQTSQDTAYVYDAGSNLDTLRSFKNDTVFATAKYTSGDRDSTFGPYTFAHDLDGNRTAVSGARAATYVFGATGRLLSVTSGATTLSFEYDAHGQLVHRRRNGASDRYYLWDNGQLIAELDSSGNNRVAEYVYYPGATDAPLALVTGAVGARMIHYYQQDVTGNVLGTFSSSGAVEQTLQYDPWGQVEQASSSLSDTTRLRWKGLLWQGDIAQLYYVRARWYDPVSRRFVSEDPLGLAAGMNQYTFAGNDPINGSDPSGACPSGGLITSLEGDNEGEAATPGFGYDCMGFWAWANDPPWGLSGRDPELNQMEAVGPTSSYSACHPDEAGAVNCAAWDQAEAAAQSPSGGSFKGFDEAIFWSNDEKVFDCRDGRIQNSVFGLMDGLGAEFAYDLRGGEWSDGDKHWYHGTVSVKVPGEVQVKYWIVGRIQCSLKGHLHWLGNEDIWATP